MKRRVFGFHIISAALGFLVIAFNVHARTTLPRNSEATIQAMTSSMSNVAKAQVVAPGMDYDTPPARIDTLFDYRLQAPIGSTVYTPAQGDIPFSAEARRPTIAYTEAIELAQVRVVSSDGLELEGAIASFGPSGTIAHVQGGGILPLADKKDGDTAIFIIHPGYQLFEGRLGNSKNLVVRAGSDVEDAKRFAALPELEQILETCRPKTIEQAKVDQPKILDDDASMTVVFPSQQTQAPTSQALTSGELVMRLSVVPNPAQDQIEVQYTLSQESKVMLELYRMDSGQRVVLQDFGTRQSGSNSLNLPLSNLSRGTYVVLLRSSSCEYAMAKFVKE